MVDLRFGDVVRGIVDQYGDDILKERRLWYILTDSYKFVYEYDLRRLTKQCVDNGYAEEILSLKGRKEDTSDYIRTIVKCEFDGEPNQEAVLTSLLGLAYGIGTFEAMDVAQFELLPKYCIPHAPTSSPSSPSTPPNPRNTPAKGCSFSIIQIFWKAFIIAIIVILAIWISWEWRHSQNSNIQQAEIMQDKVIDSSSVEKVKPDLSLMSLKERNSYLRDARKNTIKRFKELGPIEVGEDYRIAESMIRTAPQMKLLHASHGVGDILFWCYFNNEQTIMKLSVGSDGKISELILDIYEDRLDDVLSVLVDEYGQPEILPESSASTQEFTFNMADVKFNPDVKEYSWVFKNGIVRLQKDKMILTDK